MFQQFSDSSEKEQFFKEANRTLSRKEKSGLFWSMSKVLAIISGVFFLSWQGLIFCEQDAKPGEKGEGLPGELEDPPSAEEYRVSFKDVLEITIVGENDLPTKFDVSDKDGTIKYPYIEYVQVAGKTVKEIEELLTNHLKPDWFVDPQINVRVFIFSEKYVYVDGEVRRPGRLPFTGRNIMTVSRAIIMAGGFGPNAKKSKVILMTTDEKGGPKRVEVNVSDIIKGKKEFDPPVKADDRIIVQESFF